jgi:hypothetical protein
MTTLRNNMKRSFAKKQTLSSDDKPDRTISPPKLERGTPIMLTLSPDNTKQYSCFSVHTRLNKFNKNYHDDIEPIMDKIFIQYNMSLEITEQLCSEGNKYFPRLHYHLVGVVACPISFYLYMTELSVKHTTGYHIQVIDTKEDHQHYDKYILKQRKLWVESPYVIKYKGRHPTVTNKKPN